MQILFHNFAVEFKIAINLVAVEICFRRLQLYDYN
jgi:hypothetical protein